MGRKLILTGTSLTDLGAPKLANVDQIETHGSLMLLDVTHPTSQWDAGVPADGAKVPNLLSAQAAPLIGSTTQSDHDLNIYIRNFTDQTKAFAERSAKGGLHAMYNQKNPTNFATGYTTSAFHVDYNSLHKEYIRVNWGHMYYMSTWARITHGAPTYGQQNAISLIGHATSVTGNYHAWFSQYGPGVRPGRAYTSGSGWAPETSVGPRFNAAEAQNTSTTIPGSQSGVLAYAFAVSNHGTLNNYLRAKESAPSAVFYRHYLEDLTVSGRTYAEVKAIDEALYTKEVLTPGGRYYNDTTPTNPVALQVAPA